MLANALNACGCNEGHIGWVLQPQVQGATTSMCAMLQDGSLNDEERRAILPLDVESGGVKSAAGDRRGVSKLPVGAPGTQRSCGCGLLIYGFAAMLLLWAAFPAASSRMWHKASPSPHASQALGPAPAPALARGPSPAATHGGGAASSPRAAKAPATADILDVAEPASHPAAVQDPAPQPAHSHPRGRGGATSDSGSTVPLTAPAPAPESESSTDPWCPLKYPRMSVEDLQTDTPYLFGGQPVSFWCDKTVCLHLYKW